MLAASSAQLQVNAADEFSVQVAVLLGELIIEDAARATNEQSHVMKKRASADRAAMAAADAALRVKQRSDSSRSLREREAKEERLRKERAAEQESQWAAMEAALKEKGDAASASEEE
eukprot:5644285-Prymnesium_polylepis.1